MTRVQVSSFRFQDSNSRRIEIEKSNVSIEVVAAKILLVNNFKFQGLTFMPNLFVPLLGVRSFLNHFILTVDYPHQVFSLETLV